MSVTNLIPNPSFELDLSGWTFYNATVSRDAMRADDLITDYACKMVAANSGASMVAQTTVTGLDVGASYTFSVYVKAQSHRTPFSVVASANGRYTVKRVPVDETGLERRVFGFTTTASSVTLRVFSESHNDEGDILWLDKACLTKGTLRPYFDGSYPYSSWTGTAHASTSTNTAFDADMVGNLTTDEVVVVDGFCLNTLAWNVTSKTGRYTLPAIRGDDVTVPGANGKIFVPNKPVDTGVYTLSMFALGCNPDGTVPSWSAQRRLWVSNFEKIIGQCVNNLRPVDLYTWQSDGSVRHALATAIGQSMPDATLNMGGRRAEFSVVFDLLDGVWQDYNDSLVLGTPRVLNGDPWDFDLSALKGGNFTIDDATITVYGQVTTPTITNPETGTSVTLNYAMSSTEAWRFNCDTWESVTGNFTDYTSDLTSVVSRVGATIHSGHNRYLLINCGTHNDTPHIVFSGANTTSNINLKTQAKRKYWTG